MKQSVIIEVENCDDKQMSKAMKIIVGMLGIESVAVQGENRNRIAVIGNGIDSVNLTNLLRKKIKGVKLLSVTPIDGRYLSDDGIATAPEVQHPAYYRRPSYQTIVPYNFHGYRSKHLDYRHHIPNYL